jgi:hypothetical protein
MNSLNIVAINENKWFDWAIRSALILYRREIIIRLIFLVHFLNRFVELEVRVIRIFEFRESYLIELNDLVFPFFYGYLWIVLRKDLISELKEFPKSEVVLLESLS